MKVLAAYDTSRKKLQTKRFKSMHKCSFVYTVGQWVEEPNYCGDPRLECAPGIHFFRTFEEAAQY